MPKPGLFLVAALLIPSAAAFVADAGQISVSALHEGTLARYTTQVTNLTSGAIYGGTDRFAAFDARPALEDGFGRTRDTFTFTQGFCMPTCSPSPGSVWKIDAALRVPFAREAIVASEGASTTEIPLLAVASSDGTAGWVVEFDTPYLTPMPIIAGRTMLPGSSFSVQALPNPAYPVPIRILQFDAIGWTIVEGTELFQIDLRFGSAPVSQRLFYDAGSPVPVRLEWTYDHQGPQQETWTLAALEEGDVPLVDPSYVPPAPSPIREDALRAGFTRDGPDEAFVAGTSIASVAGLVRADPRGIAWFALHPDAYLASLTFAPNGIPGLLKWHLTYRDASERLDADLVTLGHSASGIATDVRLSSADAFPPYHELAGTPFACARQATSLLPSAPTSGSFVLADVRGGWTLTCEALVDTSEPAHTATEDSVTLGSAGVAASARIDGRTGGTLRLTSSSEAEATVVTIG